MKAKVGDLVRFTDTNDAWHLAHGYNEMIENRRRGVIFRENRRYFFILWEDGELAAEEHEWVEPVDGSSRR